MKIDIGCGKRGTKHAGFLGVDVGPIEEVWRRPESYVQSDAVKDGLPFEDQSADEAICLHVIEHMEPDEALTMLREIVRVLKHGATAHVATPDLCILAERYVAGDKAFWDKTYKGTTRTIWRGKTLADKFLDSLIGMGPYGHRYAYDEHSLRRICKRSGLRNLRIVEDSPYSERGDHEIVMVGEGG